MNFSENPVEASVVATYSATMPVTVVNDVVSCADTYVPHGAKKVKLYWEMVTDGWEILGVHGLPYPMFTDKGKDGYDYKCKDKNNNKTEKDYKYYIIVGKIFSEDTPLPEKGAVLVLDPTIKNGGLQ